jgi:hypothetical protein
MFVNISMWSGDMPKECASGQLGGPGGGELYAELAATFCKIQYNIE